MNKKIVISSIVIILILCVGGGFFWWQNQKDVRELNKSLPDGVRVVKSLMGKEYKVVNKIDGYEFKVPMEWRGVEKIEYIAEREEKGFRGTSANMIGLEGENRGVGIDCFKVEKEQSLKEWAQNLFSTVGLEGNFTLEMVGNFETIKTQENKHLLGMYMYFLKKDALVYSFTSGSEEFIRYIISNGKW